MTTKEVSMLKVFILVAATVFWVSRAPAQGPPMPAGMQSSFDMVEATVLKVFSAEEEGHKFVAYMVEWKGVEVVVSDPLARSDFKVGDTINFMVQKIALPQSMKGFSSLNFTLVSPAMPKVVAPAAGGPPPPAKDAGHNLKIAQGDLGAAGNEYERFCALSRAAKKALSEGKTEEARKLATELALLAPKHKADWNYGNAIQDSNQVLGRIALAVGDVDEAKKRLLASADSDGSPQMNSFGPNMQLARELLVKGEKEVVLKYFERCHRFWKMGRARLDDWAETVHKGQIPEFGANLKY